MPSQPNDLTTLLTTLAASGIEFVLVGGLAAVAQGAPVTTFDIDIVHSRTTDNIDRLIDFLRDVNARYRGPPGGEPLPPSRSALQGAGHSLFMTDFGPLDVLGEIEGGLSFDDLAPDCVVLAQRPRSSSGSSSVSCRSVSSRTGRACWSFGCVDFRLFRTMAARLRTRTVWPSPGGVAAFGDLMFESRAAAHELLASYPDDLAADVREEFFWYVDEAMEQLARVGFDATSTRFSELSWGIVARRRPSP